MKKLQVAISIASLALFTFGAACFADTFVNRSTGELLHGYTTTQTEGGKTIVHTQEKNVVKLNLADWQITADRLGRNNKVIVLMLDNEIMLEIETQAMAKAIARASDEGPLFILLEIDTLGGRTDFTKQICGAITQADNCTVIAFIKGGKYGGAISAGAAVAFACDKIYMANNTIIGAAAAVAVSGTGPQDFKKIFGEEVAEKISSAWRAYLASLAEQNNRPSLLAGAMVDEDLEVIEVSELDKRLFIDPVNKTSQQHIVHTWSKKGSLLTLTAHQALKCGIADKVVSSRQELIRDLNAQNAEIVIDHSFQKAGNQFNRAKQIFNRLSKSIDLKTKQMKQARTKPRALKLLRAIRHDYRSLLTLAKRYPDLQINVQHLQQQLNSAEAFHQEVKMRW